MKRISSIICLVLLSLSVFAQPGPFPPERMSDGEILQMQIRDIVRWLDLDKRTEARFIKEYTAFKKEIDGIVRSARPPQKLESESEIDEAIRHNFAISEQILQIRKKYYVKFKEFLKPSQVQMMYRIENEAGRRMHEGHGGMEGPEGGPGGHPAPPFPATGCYPVPGGAGN